jgi:curved DNA-binding protein CbpA
VLQAYDILRDPQRRRIYEEHQAWLRERAAQKEREYEYWLKRGEERKLRRMQERELEAQRWEATAAIAKVLVLLLSLLLVSLVPLMKRCRRKTAKHTAAT